MARANASSSKPRPTFTMCPLRRYTATGSPRFDGVGSVTCTGNRASGAFDRTSAVDLPASLVFHHRMRCGTKPRSFAKRSIDWPLFRHALRTPRASCSDHYPRCAMRDEDDRQIQIRAPESIAGRIPPRIGKLLERTVDEDRRWSWVVDGTLVPTRDHSMAAKSKNYRWSCNAQVLIRRADLRVIAIAAGGPGNRNDTVHYRGSTVQVKCRSQGRVLADGGYRGVPELILPVFRSNRILRDQRWRKHRKRRARVEHALARLKDWRVLRDHRRRGRELLDTVRAVAALHNIKLEQRDNS